MTNLESKKASGRRSGCRRTLLACLLALAVLGTWIGIREFLITKTVLRVSDTVSELDGRMMSIHFRPFGSEYYISFEKGRQFTSVELSKLRVVNELSEWSTVYVLIHFVDTNLTKEEIQQLRAQCPKCGLRRIVNSGFQFDE